ncbi:Protein of unknown function [Pseudomonas pohangensis]|uniref:DUF1302 domain-containing protein n=1 Tax=Pseudomonas pohangensis TaxID=364197 RepID=A0A1H2FA00_9PSED|nr:DUF1302 family protein [Pseudomonas pohangensis]SDU04226.1 Protein of unknown function [Pseudomonas pohangensis]
MKKTNAIYVMRRGALATAVLAAIWNAPLQAFELDTGNPDLVVRFDNTVRLNYAQRVESANSKLAASYNGNDGDNNFSSGSPVSQRADLLTEFDVVYQGNKGFRVSTASWYDAAYENVGNNSSISSNQLKNGRTTNHGLSNYADRYYNGPSGEILDAFVFAGTEFDNNMVLNGKFGQTTNYWGEALFNITQGNSFGQGGVDLGKALAVPGTEAKELFIPRKQIYGTLLVNQELTFGAQYFFGWDNSRLAASGTYLSANDPVQADNLGLVVGANPLAGSGAPFCDPVLDCNSSLWLRDEHVFKPQKSGDYGLMAKWSPEWLDGTLSAFYRETSDLLPYLAINVDAAAFGNPANLNSGNIGSYNEYYADDIKLYGLSLSKNIGSVSVGWDLNYRTNMPLRSVAATIDAAAAAAGLPGYIAAAPTGTGEIPGSRGDTIHSVLNGLQLYGDSPLWDAASLAVELGYDHIVSVDSKNENLYKGSSWYRGKDKVTPNYWSFQGSFTPTWYQVFPSVDLSMPMVYGVGLDGVSATTTGGSENAGTYSVGISADVYNKYTFDLKYVDYFGPFDTCENGLTDGNAPDAAAGGAYTCTPGQVTNYADSNPALKDRGMLTATFKTSF